MKYSPNNQSLRRALLDSLPQIAHEGADAKRPPEFTYVPISHARALDPDNSLVEGIRGSGKSFWWATLSSDSHRQFVSDVFPEAHLGNDVLIGQGFGAQAGSADAPSQDVLAGLVKDEFSPRAIWRAVVAYKAGFGYPFPAQTPEGERAWNYRVTWVTKNPEAYDELLIKTDRALDAAGQTRLILFDALDRLAEDWKNIRPLAKGLLQIALDMRATHRIRLKVFMRPDMLEDGGIIGFPDASKLLARPASLVWRRADLYALLFQCMGNASRGGDEFRKCATQILGMEWRKGGDAWVLPTQLARDESAQEQVFVALAGKAMSAAPSGYKRGKPYTWLVSHLQDGRDQVSPRSFCEALKHAAEETPDDYDLALHFRAIQSGVKSASRIRASEVTGEDYPWVKQVMNPLRGRLTVPCRVSEIIDIWKNTRVLEALNEDLKKSEGAVKLPPQHLDDGPEGVLKDLEELGLIQRLTDGRVQMPDVYRIAFGFGRRGGVKPLK